MGDESQCESSAFGVYKKGAEELGRVLLGWSWGSGSGRGLLFDKNDFGPSVESGLQGG